MRSRYWSCTGLADRIRGTPKPTALGWEEWDTWKQQARSAHPIRYWLAETVLDNVQRVVNWIPDKLYDIKYYLNNRFISRTHSLTSHPSHIRPGTWRDFGDRILPCLFDELVNYVEVDLAWKNIAWDREARKKYNPPWWAWGWWRTHSWRSQQAGLDHLAWEMSLTYTSDEVDDDSVGTPTPQAISAQEVLRLYKWWTEVYPNRPDPYEVSGWSDWCDTRRNLGIGFGLKNKTDEQRQHEHKMLDTISELEAQYWQEDTDNLIALIKLRGSLWQ